MYRNYEKNLSEFCCFSALNSTNGQQSLMFLFYTQAPSSNTLNKTPKLSHLESIGVTKIIPHSKVAVIVLKLVSMIITSWSNCYGNTKF